MNKIKFFEGYGESDLQSKVDKWVKDENPSIISTSIARSANRSCTLAVVYSDNSEDDIHNLLKS